MEDFDLIELAEAHREELGADFNDYLGRAEESWQSNRRLLPVRTRGESVDSGTAMADSIFSEVKLLVCGRDKKYAEVRKKGNEVSKAAVHAIAGVISVKCGVVLAVATSGVALAALVVLRVGVGAFCRLYGPAPKASSKGK